MSTIKTLFILYLIFVWIIGLYVYVYQPWAKSNVEGFVTPSSDQPPCPNLLVEKNGGLLLYRTTDPVETGVNPLPFYNLDEYINYVENLRKKGIQCPVLHLKHSVNDKSEHVYTEVESGVEHVIDSSNDNPPYNQDQYQGFDPLGLHIGRITELDIIHNSTANEEISDNAMDPNWGGALHTERMIQIGKYDDRKVARPIFPKVGSLENQATGQALSNEILEQNYNVK